MLDFLNAAADQGIAVQGVTLDARGYGRLLVELAANAASEMPSEPPSEVRFRGPTGAMVVVSCSVLK